MNKPEFYPYVLLPEEIEKIKIEGIPVPEIKELPDFPEKPKKRYWGTIILLVSIAVILLINLTKILKGHYSVANGITFFAFFIAIVSLTAMVFEILHNSKAKKQHRIAIKLYEELKVELEQLQQKRIQAVDDNNNPKAIEVYRHDTINKYFKYSYNKIQAVQHDQTAAHRRFMIFLEQYFEGKILENVRIVHEPKSLDYSPGFLLKLDNPKVNIAIDIEEPYQFEGTKVVVKKNKSEELYKTRHRVTNELRWVSIVFSEEQIVSHPTESCKLIANTIDEIILKEKYIPKFKGVEKLKRIEIPGQREISAQIRSKHREKYLTAAGLIDDLVFVTPEKDKKGDEKNIEKKTVVLEKDKKQEEKIKIESKENKETPKTEKVEAVNEKVEKNEKTKVVDLKKEITKKIEEKKLVEKKSPIKKVEDQKSDMEQVEQLQIVKKVTDRLRSEKQLSGQKIEKTTVQKRSNEDPGKAIITQNKHIKKVEDKGKLVKEKTTENKKEEQTPKTDIKKGQLKREAELLNKLYESGIDTEAKVDSTKKKEQLVNKDAEMQKRMQMEKERLEKKKQEHEKLLKERKAKEQLAQKDLDKKKAEQLLLEKELMNKEKREKERKEKVRLEIERLAQERKSKDRDEKEQSAKELLAKKKNEKELVEKERIAKENADKKRAEEEKLVKAQEEEKRLEQERITKEKTEKEIADKKRKVKELEDAARLEKDKQDKINKDKEKLQIEKLQKELDKKAEIEANNKILEQQKAEIEVLVVKKEWDKLNIKCNELIRKYPYWDWPYYRRSTVNGNKGEFKEVLVDCNKALGINPSFADAYYNRATAKFFLENYAEAVEDYQKCIDFDYKNSIDAYFNRGLCYKNLNYPKKAYREFLKAKDLGSSKAEEIIKQEYS